MVHSRQTTLEENVRIEDCQIDDRIYVRSTKGVPYHGFMTIVKIKVLPKGITQVKYTKSSTSPRIQKVDLPTGTIVERKIASPEVTDSLDITDTTVSAHESGKGGLADLMVNFDVQLGTQIKQFADLIGMFDEDMNLVMGLSLHQMSLLDPSKRSLVEERIKLFRPNS